MHFNIINTYCDKPGYPIDQIGMDRVKRSSNDMKAEYGDSRSFCDIDSEYPEAAYNTIKVGLHLQHFIKWVKLIKISFTLIEYDKINKHQSLIS